jgi:2-keto-4-pentenoate hydratase/2-oxohepta-3-ene-1,7-dioic acid hydratase in catechol pathway
VKWTAYSAADGRRRAGVVRGEVIHALTPEVDFLDVLRDDVSLTEWEQRAVSSPDEVVRESDVRLEALIHTPPSIRDFMAFEEHVIVSNAALGLPMDPDWYEIPVFYFSNPAAIRGPQEPVAIAPGSMKFDYELEFAALIGKTGRDIALEDAESHIAGFMAMCDWSARDLQEREMRQTLGPAKGKDSATTLGPYLVTPDELPRSSDGHTYDIDINAKVNGTLYSTGNLSALHWSFAQMIVYASRGTELRPGDIIGSGTVGTGCILELSRVHGAERYPYLEPGDTVRIEAGVLGAIEVALQPSVQPAPLT